MRFNNRLAQNHGGGSVNFHFTSYEPAQSVPMYYSGRGQESINVVQTVNEQAELAAKGLYRIKKAAKKHKKSLSQVKKRSDKVIQDLQSISDIVRSYGATRQNSNYGITYYERTKKSGEL